MQSPYNFKKMEPFAGDCVVLNGVRRPGRTLWLQDFVADEHQCAPVAHVTGARLGSVP